MVADYQLHPITPISICNVPVTTFSSIVDPTNAYNIPDKRLFDIVCNGAPSFEKTGLYQLDVRAVDVSGNVQNFQTKILVYPHPDLHVVDVPSASISSPVNSDGIAMHTFTGLLLDKFNNPVYNYPIQNIVHTGTNTTFINEITQTGIGSSMVNASNLLTSSNGLFGISMLSIAPGDIST